MKEIKKKSPERYDFNVFKNKMGKKYKDKEIDIVYKYVESKTYSKVMSSIISKILYMDRSLEKHDIIMEISMKIRRNMKKDKKYIPTWQHITRLLYKIGREYNNQDKNNQGVLDLDEYVELLADPEVDIERNLDLESFLKRNLNETDYKLIKLYYFEKYTMKELGVEFNISQQAITKKHKKIIEYLKEKSSDF